LLESKGISYKIAINKTFIIKYCQLGEL